MYPRSVVRRLNFPDPDFAFLWRHFHGLGVIYPRGGRSFDTGANRTMSRSTLYPAMARCDNMASLCPQYDLVLL
jgi:hypothetical protein